MSDDIIARLRCSYADPPCEQCTFCAARAEIERLRAAGGEERLLTRIIEVMDDLRVRRELAASVAEFAEREEFDPFDVESIFADRLAEELVDSIKADPQVLRDAKAEIDPMRAALDAVDYLHSPRLAHDTCLACNHDWPCPTQRLIREANREQ